MNIRSRLTYANVMSTIGVFAAFGGGAYAAAGLAKNSVKSKTVKNNSLKGLDVQDESLTGADIDEKTLAAGELPDGSVTGPKLADDSVQSGKIADGTIWQADIDPTMSLTLDGEGQTTLINGDEVSLTDGFSKTTLGPTSVETSLPNGGAVLNRSLTMEEMVTAGPPDANSGRIFFRENSGGDDRTELVVQFADGDVDVLEIDAP